MKKLGIILLVWAPAIASAQTQDTVLPSRTVNVTSTYKPVLQNATKINFNATLPPVDNTLPVLQYDIPAQALYFNYLPAGLEPIVLKPDSNGIKENSNYVKAGFGNFTTPYAEAGLSFGNSRNAFGIYGDHISSQGNIQYQDYSKTSGYIYGHAETGNSILYGKAGVKLDQYELYGYDQTLFPNYTKNQLEQQFLTFSGQVGLRNATSNEYGFSYDPHIDFSRFGDNHNGNEIDGVVSVPLEKRFGDNWAFRVNVAGDFTLYQANALPKNITNDIYYVTPVISYHNETFTLNAGINPTWDQNAGGTLSMYPHIDATIKVTEPLSLIAGWTGYTQKNSYQYLESLNPYLAQPDTQYNTNVRTFWGGIKGSAGPHFSYLAKISYMTFANLPLFVNDTITGMTFQTLREAKMNEMQVHGELAFAAGGHFSLTVAGDINNYINLQSNPEPYGYVPVDLSAKLRWMPVKDVTLKADLFAWGAPWYRTQAKETKQGSTAFDLNAGIDFAVSKRFGLWLDCNNILNDQYERWNQYPVLGFNILGGIVFSFGQSR
jgi:hypothetical protein